MRKNETMSRESLNRRLNKRLEEGEKLTPLTTIRLSVGLTQKELAKRTGMTQPYIARIERGERDMKDMTMQNGYRIAKALGCRMEDLL